MVFYHDRAHDVLIYPAPLPHVRTALPEGREINGRYFAVPRTLRACQVLRHYDLPVPPLIDETYDFPRNKKIVPQPYESQKVAANFMALHRRCFNLGDMGTGKTLSVLWAADWLMRQQPGFRALIVAPLSTLQRVWADAIFNHFLGARTFEILHGDAKQRIAALKRDADFYIVNHDGIAVGAHTHKRLELGGFSRQLAERSDIQLAIVDEASAYKDGTTRRHRISRLVFGNKPYLWCLTGTPTPNAPTDAYGLAKLVNNALGKSWTGFRQDTMIQLSQFKWVPRQDGYDKARQLLTPSIRFDIRDVWDAPAMTTQQREVALTDQQKKLMRQLKNELLVQVKSGPITVVNEAAARTKFIQISLGAIYDDGHRAHAVDAEPRLGELLAVIEQAPGKMLIFAPLTSIVELVYKEIRGRWPTEIVNGNVKQKARARIFSRFQDEKDALRLIVADPGTMAHGLDLYLARTVVWYGTTDKAEIYAQANKRAHRPGQRHSVSVVQIVSNPLEREIYRRLETNTSLQGTLLDMVRNNVI